MRTLLNFALSTLSNYVENCKGVGKCEWSPIHCRKISRALVYKRLKTGSEVLLYLPSLFAV